MPASMARLLFTAAFALLFAALLNVALAGPSAAQAHAVALPAAPQLTPTAVPTQWFSGTARLTTTAAAVALGDELTVTAQLVTSGTCGFALYDVTLRQANSLFTHVAPPSNVIGPPGVNPAVWRLAAIRSGVTTFTVDFYGETNCDGVWNWTTVRGASQPVTVTGMALHLPFVNRSVGVTDLGTLGGASSMAYAINNRNQIAGSSFDAGGRLRATLWQNGLITDLGTLGGDNSYALAINDRGQIVGISATAGGRGHAFFWDGGVMTDVGTLGGAQSTAVDINNQGQVIGNSGTATSEERGYLWTNGVMTDLGTLGGDVTTVNDINDRGQIVGYSQVADGQYHAFLWENGVMTDLNLSPQPHYSEATAINERGQVAGTYTVASDAKAGFVWENGSVTELSQRRWPSYNITDLNEPGQILGYTGIGGGFASRAFLWSAGTMLDLNAPGSEGFCPAVINDDGVIALYRTGDSGAGPQGPVVWIKGRFVPLSTLGGEQPTCAYAINNGGYMAGLSGVSTTASHAVLWETVGGQ